MLNLLRWILRTRAVLSLCEKLATKLEEDDFTIVDRLGDQLTAKFIKGFTMIENLIAEIVNKGFTIWGDAKGAQKLRLNSIQLKKPTSHRSLAMLKEGVSISEPEVLEREIIEYGFFMMDETIDLPSQLARNDLPI